MTDTIQLILIIISFSFAYGLATHFEKVLTLLKLVIEKRCCKHDWETRRIINRYERRETPPDKPYSIIEHLLCKKCGEFKKIRYDN